jgi:hypothetical protein
MAQDNIEYDKKLSAERLCLLHEELRAKEGLNSLSGAEIVRRIEAKIGVHIGSNTYNSHEN